MFDNLREQADSNPFDSTPFYEDEDQFREAEGAKPAPARKAKAKVKRAAARTSGRRFLGMLPWQRFVLAFMLFMTVCVVAAMVLVVTGKIGLM